MEVNIEAIKQLIDEKFRGNQTFFAETLGIDRHYLNQILLRRQKASSPKLCRAIINYCLINKIKKEKYIFFTTVVK